MRIILPIWTFAALAQLTCFGQGSAKLPAPVSHDHSRLLQSESEGPGKFEGPQASEQLSNAPGPVATVSFGRPANSRSRAIT